MHKIISQTLCKTTIKLLNKKVQNVVITVIKISNIKNSQFKR